MDAGGGVTAELEGIGGCVEIGTSELGDGAEGEIYVEPGEATDPELAVRVAESEIADVGACEDTESEASEMEEGLGGETIDDTDCTSLLMGGEEFVDAGGYGWVAADEIGGASLVAGGGGA